MLIKIIAYIVVLVIISFMIFMLFCFASAAKKYEALYNQLSRELIEERHKNPTDSH